ncbi:hypothetical protein TNCV_2058431 [Trichonephila clavipes]|nr:hypothetical protein TNCV_2058431 [Trichonephila clavipes]
MVWVRRSINDPMCYELKVISIETGTSVKFPTARRVYACKRHGETQTQKIRDERKDKMFIENIVDKCNVRNNCSAHELRSLAAAPIVVLPSEKSSDGLDSLPDSKLVLDEMEGVLGLRTALRRPGSCLVTWNERFHKVDVVTADKFCDPSFADQETMHDTFVAQLCHYHLHGLICNARLHTCTTYVKSPIVDVSTIANGAFPY